MGSNSMVREKMFSSRALARLIIPLIFEQTLAITVGMADTVMVSSVGEAAISGVSLVDMINTLIFAVMAALATGGAVVTSQYIGEKNTKAACSSAAQLMVSVLVVSCVLTAGALIFRQKLLRLFFGSIETDVFECGLTYLFITALSFPFLAIYNACAALFRSMGNSRITLLVSIIMNLINVVGNGLCIFVFKMGVAGVAVPSLVSRAVAAMILFVLLRNPHLQVYLAKGRFRPDWAMIRRILHIGIPSGVENGIFQLGRVLVVSIISGFGTVQIAANGVANNLDSMGCIMGQGFSLAVITVIGQCVGAQDEEQIRFYTKKLLLGAYLATAVWNSLLLIGTGKILHLYMISDATRDLAFTLIFLHNGAAIALWPSAFVLPNVLRACNDVNFTMAVSVFSMVAFRIGLSIVLGIHCGWGIVGVWVAMITDWIFRTLLFIGRYLTGKWKKYCLREKTEITAES